MTETQKQAMNNRGYKLAICETCKYCEFIDRISNKEYYCINNFVIEMLKPYLEGEHFMYIDSNFGCNQWVSK